MLLEPLRVEVDVARVLSAEGIPPAAQARLGAQIVQMHRQVVEEVTSLTIPRAVASLRPVALESRRVVCGEFAFRASSRVRRRLVGVDRAYFLACTVGSKVDQYIRSLLERGETARAWVAETAASYAVSEASVAATALLARRFDWEGVTTTLAPGEDGWDLREQAAVIALAGGEALSIEMSDGGVMRPSKTVTAMLFQSHGNPACTPRCNGCERRNSCSFHFSERR